MLSELLREDPECLPRSRSAPRGPRLDRRRFIPPDWDERYVTCFGFTLDDIYQEGAAAMKARLRAAGIEPEQLRIGLPFDISVAERVQRAVTLLKAGYLGPPNGKVAPDPERPSCCSTAFAARSNAGVLNRPATIQWDFTDADAWHLTSTTQHLVAPGRVPHPDLTFRAQFNDWIDLTAGRIEPWRAARVGQGPPAWEAADAASGPLAVHVPDRLRSRVEQNVAIVRAIFENDATLSKEPILARAARDDSGAVPHRCRVDRGTRASRRCDSSRPRRNPEVL